jgi:hypothetical protein
MPNRISSAITQIESRLEKLDESDRNKLERDMSVTFQEHFAYQTAQARAHAMGRITYDEAQIIYASLGEIGSDNNGGWSEGTTLAAKVAITSVMFDLIR